MNGRRRRAPVLAEGWPAAPPPPEPVTERRRGTFKRRVRRELWSERRRLMGSATADPPTLPHALPAVPAALRDARRET